MDNNLPLIALSDTHPKRPSATTPDGRLGTFSSSACLSHYVPLKYKYHLILIVSNDKSQNKKIKNYLGARDASRA